MMKMKINQRISVNAIRNPRIFILMASLLISGLVTVTNAKSPLASKEQIGLFMNSTTCVVLEDGSISYNIFIKDAVENNWDITEFEFIDKEEFEERRFKSKYSFLLLAESTFEEDPEGVSYNFLNLVMGGGAQEVTEMPELVSIPLAYTDDPEIDYAYAMPAMVNFVQRHVRFIQTRRFMATLFGMKYYNQSREFKDKALILTEDQMSPEMNTLFKIKDVYPYYVRLVSPEERDSIVSGDQENILFLLHVGPETNDAAGQCFELIFNQEGELYYYNYREVTNAKEDGFTKQDLRRIRF